MPWLRYVLLLFALGVLMYLVQLGIITVAFAKLGLAPDAAYLLLIVTLLGSFINLPLFRLQADADAGDAAPPPIAWPRRRPAPFRGRTVIAVNVGGAAIPVAFSLFLLAHYPLDYNYTLLCTALVTAVAYGFSRALPGVGVMMPMLLAPLAAALSASWLDAAQRAPLAYIGGTFGVLLGADILRLRDIRRMRVPLASIGGAGTFDGIFLTGFIAVLLT
jgi:uncharacterized membrane protein